MMFVLVFLAGAAVGAGVAWFLAMRQFNQHQLQQELTESKEQLQQYRSDVSSHLETTQQLMSQLQENYEKIARHMASTKMTLVERQSPTIQNNNLNYLTTDTAQQIRQSIDQIEERRRKPVIHSVQPLDYSGESSGLMKASSQKQPQDE